MKGMYHHLYFVNWLVERVDCCYSLNSKYLLPIQLVEFLICLLANSLSQSNLYTSMCFRWVPIKGNDWYWIRHHIKVGMDVMVEILVSIVALACTQ